MLVCPGPPASLPFLSRAAPGLFRMVLLSRARSLHLGGVCPARCCLQGPKASSRLCLQIPEPSRATCRVQALASLLLTGNVHGAGLQGLDSGRQMHCTGSVCSRQSPGSSGHLCLMKLRRQGALGGKIFSQSWGWALSSQGPKCLSWYQVRGAGVLGQEIPAPLVTTLGLA